MTTSVHVDHYSSLLAVRGAPGGNKAGVVHVTDGLPTDAVMQEVAKVVGFSETAFVWAQDNNVVHVRFFTPEGEVDLCGHATIAVFSAMPPSRVYAMHTKKSVLRVETDADGRVTMDQDAPTFRAPDSSVVPSILDALGLTRDDAPLNDIPPVVVSTGLPDLFVAVKSRAILHDRMRPHMDKISAISKELDTIGFHVFTLDCDEGFTAECRNFAPLFGIDEEAATGTSSGALAALLSRRDTAIGTTTKRMAFAQGRNMQLPSRIEAIASRNIAGRNSFN
ncbi:Aste57867_9507 [Aphanomyces stellatus]|uniref:Aste57867_9507 protein n=1 Tax=Aphanomyces stellatus TaxID=120398 RepID=A0A485KNJ7_9STRA|nr:hypothetical protein As57867_009470 [Aphanomyces stellatus]VFT86386.1 Aste57867_9507 [Aphanomyces stellatus]